MPVRAQDRGAVAVGVLEEVVVTAAKRAQALQDVPMSITALSGASLERMGVREFADYAVRVPNLSFAYTSSGQNGSQSIAIRGVSGRNTTGFYIDDTPLFESLNPRVIDLERIEVLRGPQGTLYGARSMGGTVRQITRQPNTNEFEARVHGRVASVSEGDVDYAMDGVVNLPIVDDVLAIRALGYYEHQSGYYDRVPGVEPILLAVNPLIQPSDFSIRENLDDKTTTGAVIKARFELMDDRLVVTPGFQTQKTESDGFSNADVQPGNFRQLRLFDVDESSSDEWQHYFLTASYDTGVGTIVSSTGYVDRTYKDREDFSEVAVLFFGTPPTPAVIRASADVSRFVQELRFVSDFDGRFQLVSGLFYSKTDDLNVFPETPLLPFIENVFSQRRKTDVEEFALFGEGTMQLSDSFSLTLGLRWFDNSVEFAGENGGVITANETFAGSQQEQDINPKVLVEYRASEDLLFYASGSKGFRIGGVNSYSTTLCAGDLATLPGDVQSFDSDSLWSYEVGGKSTALEGRLTANLAAYSIDWKDIQQVVALPSCGFAVIVNAGKAEIQGFDLEVGAEVAPGLTIGVGLGFADGEITDNGGLAAIPEGRPLQQVPEWTASGSLQYEFSLANRPAFLRGDYAYVDESFSANNSSQLDPRLRPSYEIVDLRFGFQLGKAEVSVFAKNITNENANFSDLPSLAAELPTRPRIVTNRPRTVGLEVTTRF
jgi:outer membrane receptor protein involved in Fe transport